MTGIPETIRVLGALNNIKQYVIDPLKAQFSYLCCSNSILESLRAEVQSLEIVRASLQLDVDAARRNLEIIGPDVERWLERVNEIKKETDRILGAMPEVQQRCVNGSCSHLKLRYSISRKAKKMAKAVVEVRDAGKFDRVAHPAPPPGMEIIPVPSGTEFESRKTKEEEIMAALRDESVYLIGICGMGGVGKTTMANKIWKRAKEEEKLFDVVAMAVVSQQIDRKRIQKKIAEYLGLKLKEDDISISAEHLRTRLMQEKSILIIIDDIWEALNPVELGIPSPREHKGCKIILTSRHHGVCTGTEAKLREMETTEMKATKILSLDVLTENEAWALFKSKAGSIVDRCDLHQIAKNVAKECKGLPLALVTVGCAMAETNAQENPRPVWEDALGQLQRSAPSDIEEVIEKVYLPLELSYNHLKSDEARYLFLLCCLFPEDSRISLKNLLYYGVGLRVFSNVETLREARNRVYALVGRLESRYMLMDAGTDEGFKCVKMHDVIRDVAIYIASKGEHIFMTSHGLKDWPRKDSYENYTHISLTLEKSVTLPDCINFPRLKMLRMKSHGDVEVPDTFFDRIREFNVLDITNIRSLPSSLQSLTNLRILRLHWGRMEDVSMIGQLVKLEILDLSYSKLQVLPKEIGGLENLKSLNLGGCRHLREITTGVISRLVRLEKLFMLSSFIEWGVEVEGGERRNASFVEVASLKNLTALQLLIPDPKVLPQDTLHWPELERSVICIGRSFDSRGKYCGDNNLILDLEETTPSVHALIRKADCLELTLRRMGASDELIKLIQERSEHLESLELEDCHNMKYFVNKLFKENNVYPKLRFLSLSGCDDIKGISSVMPSLAGSFDVLEDLELKNLCMLTHFWDQNKVFPNLKKLSLSQLPNFICFWEADNGIESSCLFNQKVTFASILNLTLHSIGTATKIFSSQIPVDSFSWLEELEVHSCLNLEVIFSPPAFRNFRSLRHLTVKNCPKLEELVEKEDEKSQAVVKEVLFPELKELTLTELPNFKTFCRMENDIELPQLEGITIEDCHKMETFAVGSVSLPNLICSFGLMEPDLATRIFFKKEVFANLVEMELSNINATKIFSSQIPIDSFSWLERLRIDNCSNLKVIFSPHILRNFRTLRELIVSNCSKLEEVVEKEDEELQATVKEPLFPELKELRLSKLQNFMTFCHMKNDIELPQLESITIEDCHKMETFCVGSLSLPSLAYVFGLLKPDLATRILFKKETPTPSRESHFYTNSFTLSAEDLSGFEMYDSPLCLAKDSSDNFIAIWRASNVYSFKIGGIFDMAKLQPSTCYEVAFEIKLEGPSLPDEGQIKFKLTQSEGSTQKRLEDVKHRPREEWIEILVGKFTTGPDPFGNLEFSLSKDYIEGLFVKGVIIRPEA